MARPLRVEYEDAYYHIIQRGLGRRKIYKTDKDKKRFLRYVEESTNKFKSICHAYCLMDNHYHLMIQTPGRLCKRVEEEGRVNKKTDKTIRKITKMCNVET